MRTETRRGWEGRERGLAGEIDHDVKDILGQALSVGDDVRPRIVADLSEVTFLDSSGINILQVRIRKRLKRPRSRLVRRIETRAVNLGDTEWTRTQGSVAGSA
ncbi:STAS domain-containing protein [Streptomyces sp. NPDC085937]|uniref:STAS domain-containing protein n=1 Tax=Streptomyces sp. NPDC085937 TaxID=3365742 RepID=UPI0037D895DF